MSVELKKYNTFRVIKKIVRDGPVSKSDIRDSLLLTNASILSRTNELAAKNLVVATGYEKKAGNKSVKGRYSNLLDTNDSVCFTFGFLIEKDAITGVLSTLKLKILEKIKYNISNLSVDTAVNMIKKIYNDFLEHSCLNSSDIVGSSVAVSEKCYEEIEIEKCNDKISFEKFEKALKENINSRFYVTSISTALGVYYFDKSFSSKVTPQKYKVMLFDFKESQTITYVQFYTGLQFLDVLEKSLKSCILKYDYTNVENSEILKKGTVSYEINPKNILNDVYSDSECTPEVAEICEGSFKRDMYDHYLQTIGHLLAVKEPLAIKYMKRKLSGLAVLLYNMFSTFSADKVIVTDFVLSDYLFPLFKESVIELFNEKVYNSIEFAEDDEAILKGASTNAFNMGFIPYYYES